DDLAVLGGVDTDIDHDGALFDPVALDQVRHTDGHDQDLRPSDVILGHAALAGGDVTDGDGTEVIEEQQPCRLAHDVAVADNHYLLAVDVHSGGFHQLKGAQGGAGNQAG